MATIASIESDISLGLGLLASFGQNVDVFGIFSNGAGQAGAASSSGLSGLSPSILNSILGIPNQTASIGQLFTNARPLKATIRETSKVMEHPVETGATLSDHHIINPIEIDVSLVVTNSSSGLISSLIGGSVAANYAITYSQIRQAFIRATPLAVKTRVGVYSNMIIADMPHEENADMFDVITINLHLKQVIYVLPNGTLALNYQPLAADNSNTISSGLQQATGLSTQILSTAAGIASYASVLRL